MCYVPLIVPIFAEAIILLAVHAHMKLSQGKASVSGSIDHEVVGPDELNQHYQNCPEQTSVLF